MNGVLMITDKSLIMVDMFFFILYEIFIMREELKKYCENSNAFVKSSRIDGWCDSCAVGRIRNLWGT
ncbi:hypothetical protein T07_9793 [Trichinella nelsoni]|uniref:Uncharacterized protein n=1 Tax=Trichinella nelsoni TaxID=6336 RepID=A0A0V0RNX9_9BILA|nr:hypothetical protein T07_9793 [Trichinella nelsoni]